ncbi:SIS domain-containing protein [Mesorhizobium sp. M0046]|uniref:SIS domain-containing protein n=1 Tax=Mesorhizobium sp. M0046 TaxID=2956858 RepID=UPI00333C2922
MSGRNQTNTPYSKRASADWLQMLDRAREVIRREAKALEAVAAGLNEQICCLAEHILLTSGSSSFRGSAKRVLLAKKSQQRSPPRVHARFRLVHLTRISAGDVFLALSNSGETEELRQVVSALKEQPVFIALVTGRANSSLAQVAHSVLDIGPVQEVCALGLTPTASTTAMMAVGETVNDIPVRMRRPARTTRKPYTVLPRSWPTRWPE